MSGSVHLAVAELVDRLPLIGAPAFGRSGLGSQMTEGVLPHDPRVQRFSRLVTLERGLLLGISTGLVGGPCACSAAGLPNRRPVARMSQKLPPTRSPWPGL